MEFQLPTTKLVEVSGGGDRTRRAGAGECLRGWTDGRARDVYTGCGVGGDNGRAQG